MPELAMKGQRGSALVGAVALALAMAAGGVGYLLISGSAANDEAMAVTDTQAMHAAESGVLLGTFWAGKQSWPTPTNGDLIPSLEIGGMEVNVRIEDHGATRIVAGEVSHPNLPYIKRVEWDVSDAGSGATGTFFNRLQPSNEQGIIGLNNVIFDGPFHSNEAIIISPVSEPVAGGAGLGWKNGLVTTYNSTGRRVPQDRFKNGDPYGTGDFAEYGELVNNYDLGVFKKNTLTQGENHAEYLDKYFTDRFLHSQDYVYLDVIPDPGLILDGGDQDPCGAMTQALCDQDFTKYRPLFQFNADGTATYITWKYELAVWTPYSWSYVGENLVSTPLTSGLTFLTPDRIDGKQIRITGNDVYVRGDPNAQGVFSGNSTIRTQPGFSIFAAGDLRVTGFSEETWDPYYDQYDNSTNYGVPMGSDDVAGLISGADVIFPHSWIDPNDGVGASDKKIVSIDEAIDGTKELFFNAQIVAMETDGTHNFHQKNGDVETAKYQYELRFIGTRTLDRWYNYVAGGVNNNQKFRFFYDQRPVRAPGMPQFKSDGPDNSDGTPGTRATMLTKTAWKECNNPTSGIACP